MITELQLGEIGKFGSKLKHMNHIQWVKFNHMVNYGMLNLYYQVLIKLRLWILLII